MCVSEFERTSSAKTSMCTHLLPNNTLGLFTLCRMPAIPHAAPYSSFREIFPINELIPLWAPESGNAGNGILGAYDLATLEHHSRANPSHNGLLMFE